MENDITLRIGSYVNKKGEKKEFSQLVTPKHPTGIRLLHKKKDDDTRMTVKENIEFLKSTTDWRQRVVYAKHEEHGPYAVIDMVDYETVDV